MESLSKKYRKEFFAYLYSHSFPGTAQQINLPCQKIHSPVASKMIYSTTHGNMATPVSFVLEMPPVSLWIPTAGTAHYFKPCRLINQLFKKKAELKKKLKFTSILSFFVVFGS